MREDLSGVPSGLGFNSFMLLIGQLSSRGYRCQVGDVGGIDWIQMTKRDGFTAYFDSWSDVFEFNDVCADTIEMYEKEEADREDHE